MALTLLATVLLGLSTFPFKYDAYPPVSLTGMPNRKKNFANSVLHVRDPSASTQTSWRIWPIHLSCSVKYQHISSGGIGSSSGIRTHRRHVFASITKRVTIIPRAERSPCVPAVLGGAGLSTPPCSIRITFTFKHTRHGSTGILTCRGSLMRIPLLHISTSLS